MVRSSLDAHGMITRDLIGTVALDCDCRQRVNDALQRFVAQEQSRHDRRCLMDVRQQRASIAAAQGSAAMQMISHDGARP